MPFPIGSSLEQISCRFRDIAL